MVNFQGFAPFKLAQASPKLYECSKNNRIVYEEKENGESVGVDY